MYPSTTMSASESLPSTSNTSVKKWKGNEKPVEDVLETNAEAKREEAEVKRQEPKVKREEAEVKRKEHDVEKATKAQPTSAFNKTFIRLVTRSALGVLLPLGLELRPQDRWEGFLVQAETRLRMHLTLPAIILSSSILFIATAHITQHALTSTASYKALIHLHHPQDTGHFFTTDSTSFFT
ncbi:uncharacterized protein F5147DRAFT_436129 [Suillus discolor]|uniref:Uncharacterized protein n=1 Tax=Suillus discolor TaxID=1912936 RepID=A0A9P7EUE9_9AGAM|nr:uncharacterized protein F5147DRAFT_436129 [Suillus discolor]KAG2091811.1 hypothetical protein F5147DRAFT_436129 [Suillus discolor]